MPNSTSSTFPQKLFNLMGSENPEIIGWLAHGLAFKVLEPDRFVDEIMPKYFRHTKLTSFQRQLNLYGFRRVTKGNDQGAYFHQKFQRNRSDLVVEIRRLPTKSTSNTGAGAEDLADASHDLDNYISDDSQESKRSIADKMHAEYEDFTNDYLNANHSSNEKMSNKKRPSDSKHATNAKQSVTKVPVMSKLSMNIGFGKGNQGHILREPVQPKSLSFWNKSSTGASHGNTYPHSTFLSYNDSLPSRLPQWPSDEIFNDNIISNNNNLIFNNNNNNNNEDYHNALPQSIWGNPSISVNTDTDCMKRILPTAESELDCYDNHQNYNELQQQNPTSMLSLNEDQINGRIICNDDFLQQTNSTDNFLIDEDFSTMIDSLPEDIDSYFGAEEDYMDTNCMDDYFAIASDDWLLRMNGSNLVNEGMSH